MNTEFSIPDEKNNFEEYFSIFENINEAVCINTKEGIIFFVNRSTLDLFEYSIDEIIGMNITDLYANPEVRPEIINILENKGEIKDFPVKLKKKNGEIINCEFNTKVKKDEKGNKIFYGFIRDITKRKKIEDKIRESEEKYRTLFENASDSIFLLENGIFIDCNSKTLDIFHCRKEDLIGKSPVQVSPSIQPDGMKSKDKAKEKIQAALKGNPQFFEWRHRRPDGTLFDTEVSLNVIDMSKGRYILAIVRDVTERKIIEERIRKSEEKFRTIFEASADIITYVDRNGNIIDTNTKVKDILGYTRDEIVGKNFRELKLIGIEELPKLIKLFIKTIRSGNVSDKTEITLRNKNGTKVQFEVATKFIKEEQHIVGAVSVLRDITERKKIKDVLEKEKEKLYSLLNELPGYVCLYTSDLSINFSNKYLSERFGKVEGRKCFEILGYEKNELIGKSILEVTYPDDFEITKNSLNALVNGDLESYFVEKRYKKKDGSVFWGELFVSGIRKEDKDFQSIVGVIVDINKRKQAEELLKKNEEKYRELVENANSIIAKFDKDGRIISMNEFGLKLFGYKQEELIGKTWAETILPKVESTGKLLETLAIDIIKDVDKYSVNLNENVKKNGERIWVYWTNRPIRDKDGQITGILSVGTDVTDKIIAEKQMEKNVEYFAHLVDHIRNPLAILSGFIQVKVDNEETKARLIRQIDRIDDMIKQLDKGWIDTEETRKFLKKHR